LTKKIAKIRFENLIIKNHIKQTCVKLSHKNYRKYITPSEIFATIDKINFGTICGGKNYEIFGFLGDIHFLSGVFLGTIFFQKFC